MRPRRSLPRHPLHVAQTGPIVQLQHVARTGPAVQLQHVAATLRPVNVVTGIIVVILGVPY